MGASDWVIEDPQQAPVPAPSDWVIEDADLKGVSFKDLAKEAVPLNFGAKAAAGIRSVMGEEYEKALEDERVKTTEFREAHPGYAIAANLAGGVVPGMGIIGRLGQGASKLGTLARSGTLGAGMGGIAGYNETGTEEGTYGGAAVGAGIGAALPAGAAALSSAAEKMTFSPTLARADAATRDFLRRRFGINASADMPAIGSAGAQANAEQIYANQLMREGRTIDEVRQALDEAHRAGTLWTSGHAQDRIALADIGGGTQRLLGSAVRASPETAKDAKAFFQARQTGFTPDDAVPRTAGIPHRPTMAPPMTGAEAEAQLGSRFNTPEGGIVPMGQGESLGDMMKRGLHIKDSKYHNHGTNALRTDQELVGLQRQEAREFYGDMRSKSDGYDISSHIQPVIDDIKKLIKSPDTGRTDRMLLAKGLKEFEAADGSTVTSLNAFDQGKRAVDAIITTAERQGNYNVGRVLRGTEAEPGLLRRLLAPVDVIGDNGIGAAYVKARNAFATRERSREVLQMGRDAWRQESDVGLDAFNSLQNEAERKFFRLGYVSGYEKDAAAKGITHDKTKLFDTPNRLSILGGIAPASKEAGAEFADLPQRMGKYINSEKRMVETQQEAFGNSKTAQRIADDAAYETQNKVVDHLNKWRESGSLTAVGIKVVESALSKAFGMRADTSANLGRMLLTADPTRQRVILSRVEQRMGRDRLDHFQRLLQQAPPRAAPGATSAAVGQVVDQQP